MSGTFTHAEARGGCAIGGEADAVGGVIGGFADDVDAALAAGTPNVCQQAKLLATGKKARCLLTVEARAAASGDVPDPGRLQACRDRLTATFDTLDARGGCATTNDAANVESRVDGLVDTVVADEPVVATCALVGCPVPTACDGSQGACWTPALTSRFQYQLEAATTAAGACAFPATDGIDVGLTATPFVGGSAVAPEVYDVDLLVDTVCAAGGSNDVDATAAVDAIHAAGAKAVCYVDAGTDEPFRPDHQSYVDFDAACGGCLFGRPVGGFREERWLDVNDDRGQRTFVLGRVAARVDRCKADGFDAVELDNVDGYANVTGLPLSAASQLLFDSALANLVHARGLAVGLKNDLDQVPELLPYFDFAVNEQCAQYAECDALDPFVATGKAAFEVEYAVPPATFCPHANAAGRNAIAKQVDLFDVPWTPCR
jgi:hypothetical protein